MPDPTRTAAHEVGTASMADPGATTGGDPAHAGLAAMSTDAGRYTLGAEIARGGMGAVYRATDSTFAREVAVKVLLDRYAPTSGTARRFADEARITGQLQHPGVPPAFDLGALPDGRPFLAMKLIRGETLDALLTARPDPGADRGRFVAIFEKVCEAVAYAHAHGVVHRDLKPQNVMVGQFGEVQVMDWGLAKVLTGRGPGDAGAAQADTAPATGVESLRDSEDLLTQAGSVLGTPAYMPPEQAIGAVHEVDARSDVFGLGGILAAILSGRPPFVGDTAETTRVMAARGEVGGCFARLDSCGADPELVALAKRCLAPGRDDRPVDAGWVAQEVAALRAAADDRARRAELDRVRAEAEAAGQRKRRRVAAVAGLVTAGVLAAGLTGTAVGLVRAENARIAEAGERKRAEDAVDDLTVARKVAEDRLATYRRAVDAFVNEAPGILDNHPLSGYPRQELLRLTLRLMEEAQGKSADAGIADRGRLAVLVRQVDLAQAEGRLDDALQLSAEARPLAEALAAAGAPERDTGTGNLAVLLGRRAAVHRTRADGLARTDKAAARGELDTAVRLLREALALQQRLLDEPVTGEVPRGGVRAQLGATNGDLAVTYRSLAANAATPEVATAALTAARECAMAAEAHHAAALRSGQLAVRETERAKTNSALASLEVARVCEKLGDLDAADSAYDRAFTGLIAIAKARPGDLTGQKNLSVVAAEYGDLLLIRRANPKKAEAVYFQSVVGLLPVAQPPELESAVGTLALNYYRLATANLRNGDVANARRRYGVCAELRQSQLGVVERRASGVKGPPPPALVSARVNLMLAQARAGKHAEAVAAARDLAEKFPTDARRLMFAGTGHALAADVADRTEQAAQYRDEAFLLLALAIEKGYTDTTYFESDPDLDPIRGDPRFQKLKDAVAAKAPKPSER